MAASAVLQVPGVLIHRRSAAGDTCSRTGLAAAMAKSVQQVLCVPPDCSMLTDLGGHRCFVSR